jgi:glutathione S-transferase
MKLYYHPLSTTSRPVLMFLGDHHMRAELELVDLFAGANRDSVFTALNPNQAVPVLDDDGFVLTESSAILKYLAERVGSPSYPSEPRPRALVNAAMDWFNTGFYRDLGYGLVYPTALPEIYGLSDPGAHAAQLAQARQRARRWLDVLDRHMLRDGFVCGAGPTLADYLGVSYATAGDWIGFDWAPWPNVQHWMARMRARPGCREVFQHYDAWTAGLRAKAAAAEPSPVLAAE